jgi:hypothetical protein
MMQIEGNHLIMIMIEEDILQALRAPQKMRKRREEDVRSEN